MGSSDLPTMTTSGFVMGASMFAFFQPLLVSVASPKSAVCDTLTKATGSLEGVQYEEVRYEGYGIGGAAGWW